MVRHWGPGCSMPRPCKPASLFRYFNSSPEIIRLVVMMYVRFPRSLRNVEDLLGERGIDICHESVRHWGNKFGPIFAADVRRQRASRTRRFRQSKRISMDCFKDYRQDALFVPSSRPRVRDTRQLLYQARD